MNQISTLIDILSEVENISERYNKLEHYYVYVTFFDDGHFYIGSRICKCNPKDDDYIGSYKDQSHFNPIKFILKEFATESEMIFNETLLIEKYQNHSHCINVNTSPRTLSVNNSPNIGFIKTRDLMNMYGVSSPSTLSNWCRLAEIDRVRFGKFFYIKQEDKSKLDDLSNYIKSGHSYEQYLTNKNKTPNEIKSLLSEIKGL